MKQFNLEEYLQNPNRQVVTRDGRPARIICTDRKSINSFDGPILALINIKEEGREPCYSYSPDGEVYENGESEFDLFFAPVKKEGWVNLYTGYLFNVYVVSKIFSTEEDAKKEKPVNYVATIKIEWEE